MGQRNAVSWTISYVQKCKDKHSHFIWHIIITVTDLAYEVSQLLPHMGKAHLFLYLGHIPFPFQILDRPLQLSEKKKGCSKLDGFGSCNLNPHLTPCFCQADTDTLEVVTKEETNYE